MGKRDDKLSIALIKPPFLAHHYRGTGTYTNNLFETIRKFNDVEISLVDTTDNVSRFDLVHYPYFDPFFLTLPLLKPKPTVVTVHDLIPLRFPKQFLIGLRGFLKWRIQKFSLQGATALITDSHASQGDIQKFTSLSSHKIHVIYLAAAKDFGVIGSKQVLMQVKEKYRLPDYFILHVGDVNYNKNMSSLIHAFGEVNKLFPEIHLLLVGNGFVTPSSQLKDLNSDIMRLKLNARIRRFGFVPLSDLAAFYNLTEMYVQPSFAEGFGLPVLEAMACGCPVIASNTSSLGEIVQDAGLLVNPQDTRKIAKAIVELYRNKSKKNEVIRKGFTQVKKFSWQKCAKETISVYKQIYKEKL